MSSMWSPSERGWVLMYVYYVWCYVESGTTTSRRGQTGPVNTSFPPNVRGHPLNEGETCRQQFQRGSTLLHDVRPQSTHPPDHVGPLHTHPPDHVGPTINTSSRPRGPRFCAAAVAWRPERSLYRDPWAREGSCSIYAALTNRS